jgi:hypothetical protein
LICDEFAVGISSMTNISDSHCSNSNISVLSLSSSQLLLRDCGFLPSTFKNISELDLIVDDVKVLMTVGLLPDNSVKDTVLLTGFLNDILSFKKKKLMKHSIRCGDCYHEDLLFWRTYL